MVGDGGQGAAGVGVGWRGTGGGREAGGSWWGRGRLPLGTGPRGASNCDVDFVYL